jgi:hypothetical protein
VSLLREHVAPDLSDRVVVVSGGGRHADGGEAEVRRRADEAVAAQVAADELAIIGRLQEALGRGSGGRDGASAVVGALQRGEVATLILTDAVVETGRTAWFGDEPLQLALDRADLDAMGVDQPRQADLVDVVVRAAVLSDAEVVVTSSAVEVAPRDGIGALLRFDPRDAHGPGV